METYIALLRGINVGGKKRIKMNDLKDFFESLGFQNIKTYIQSGNVIFQGGKEDREISKMIENKIIDSFGFEVKVIIRSYNEFKDIIEKNPFNKYSILGNEKLYVTLLSEKPTEECVSKFMTHKNEIDDAVVLDREVYILCREPYSDSLYSNAFIEKKLKVSATTRNWETVNKIISISEEMV